jgi:hypothetical protein
MVNNQNHGLDPPDSAHVADTVTAARRDGPDRVQP